MKKEKLYEEIEPRFSFIDMPEEMKNESVVIARKAWGKISGANNLTEKKEKEMELKYYKDMALFVKHEMEKKYPAAWHVVIGNGVSSNF